MVHFGQAQEILAKRQATLAAAYERHPERFVHGLPQPQPLPDALWINPPKSLLPVVQSLAPGAEIDRSVSIESVQFSPHSG